MSLVSNALRKSAGHHDAHCLTCGEAFRPRPSQVRDGVGKYCSKACGLVATRKTEAFKIGRIKGAATHRAGLADGRIKPKLGPDNPCWTGGVEAARARQIENGNNAKKLREYRAKNPHKAREWLQNRRNKKRGKLPRGTVAKLFELQRGRCANCACSIAAGYHVDHVMPIAKGGKHEPGNVQLLCGPCNLRKSSRHPITFAQLNGRLL